MAAETLIDRLEHVRSELVGAADRMCPEDRAGETWALCYSDGRPVVSVIEVADRCYVHTWHPDKSHAINAPGELDVITAPDGSRRRVIVNAVGFLDTITLTEITGAGDGQPARA